MFYARNEVNKLKEISRAYKFASMYYDWVCKCLEDDEKYEELAFFKLGVDLMVRQKELVNIKFSQIEEQTEDDDREYKYRFAEPSYYEPRPISKSTYDAINRLWTEDKEKIFEKSSVEYTRSIVESIGDDRFNAHMMRSIGIHFLSELCEQIESMEDNEE